ncbi:anti-sigma factor [Aurantiacibacter hainanensis]|uniref:anti-sigma factor n=1 Tax=Aurantiacibacter hainanensis TaxID=3076114 RepID=UPI0030C688F1
MTDEPALAEDQVLAGEFVLGLLEGERLLLARGKLAREPAFADEVARWEDRFAPLLDAWDEVTPPQGAWDRIEQTVSGAGPHVPGAGVVELLALRRSRDRWRWMGGASLAGAVALALTFVLTSGPEIPEPDLSPGDEAPLLAASIPIADTPLRLALTWVPEREQLSVSSTGLAADGVHDHELWLVDGQGDLHSLGVIVPGEEARFAVDASLADHFHDGTQLLLTREPLGGKPADAEAGPVVAEGQFTAI